MAGDMIWRGGRGKGRFAGKGGAREIEYIIASNHVPLIREIERLDNPFYYLILIIPNLISFNFKSNRRIEFLPSCFSFSTTELIPSSSAMTTNQGTPLSFFERDREITHVRLRTSSVFQNAIVRSKGDKQTYFGHEIALCRDRSSLQYRRTCEKVENALRHNPRPTCSLASRATSSTGTHKRQFGMECSSNF